MEILSLQGVLAIDVGTAALAIGLLFLVRIPQPRRSDEGVAVTPRLVLRDVRDGWRYIINWPGMLAILLMATLINFLLNQSSVCAFAAPGDPPF